MSRRGYLVWYTDSGAIEPELLLKKLPEVIGLGRADSVYRLIPAEDHRPIRLASDVIVSELFRLYVPDTCLYVDAEKAEVGDRIERVIRESVPEAIRGEFMPNRPFFCVGKNHFVDAGDATETEIEFTAMIGCWGYSTPNDRCEMSRQVFALQEIRAERKRLEQLMGKVRESLYLEF